ncbi:hypothetical protein KIH39_08640 [Telmatocola sphagniphila]|jgi:hypothetical protein|uniref:Uncharacterized protein n=1 Tax=Telmatocola sphagniphila TaxID=1123043 RepID=A0A8E6B9N1_9BACT|nr:hypothetical protein [Telmatocola sphagniphila]QVL33959.1 hypothetical protein KIH39_08640 [Telmatocola sphagniphila]
MAQSDEKDMWVVLRGIGEVLIVTVPEKWKEATMRIEVQASPAQTIIKSTIWSEQFPLEILEANEEIWTAIREFQLLCLHKGLPWVKLNTRIERVGPNWTISNEFD